MVEKAAYIGKDGVSGLPLAYAHGCVCHTSEQMHQHLSLSFFPDKTVWWRGTGRGGGWRGEPWVVMGDLGGSGGPGWWWGAQVGVEHQSGGMGQSILVKVKMQPGTRQVLVNTCWMCLVSWGLFHGVCFSTIRVSACPSHQPYKMIHSRNNPGRLLFYMLVLLHLEPTPLSSGNFQTCPLQHIRQGMNLYSCPQGLSHMFLTMFIKPCVIVVAFSLKYFYWGKIDTEHESFQMYHSVTLSTFTRLVLHCHEL